MQIINLLSWARSSPEIPLFGGKIGACAELRRLIVKPLARADPGSRALGFGAFGRSADPLASGPLAGPSRPAGPGLALGLASARRAAMRRAGPGFRYEQAGDPALK